MTNEDVTETLLLCVRQIRSEAEEISSVRHYLHVLLEIVLKDNKLTECFRERIDQLEEARRDSIEPLLSRLDRVIRKLEGEHKPRVH